MDLSSFFPPNYIGIYTYSQILVAVLSIIIIFKLSKDYREEETQILLVLIGFFIINILMAVTHFTIIFFKLENQIILFGFTGRAIISMILVLMTGYLLTVVVYLLEYKYLYFIPFIIAIIVIFLGFTMPEDVYFIVRLIVILIFTFPAIGLFFYVSNKKKDGTSLAFAIYLILESIMGPIILSFHDIAGILHMTANIVVFIGVYGLFDKLIFHKEEKTWTEEHL